MNADPADADHDAPAATPPPEGDPHGSTAPDRASPPSASPGEYKRQHLGREFMDRMMLHRAMLEDLADELEASDTPAPSPEPPPASQE